MVVAVTKKRVKVAVKTKLQLSKFKKIIKLLAQVSNPTIHLLSVLSPQLLFNVPESNIISITSNHHAPPVIYDNPLYLKHRVLLI
jgi:hypothetical protein